MGGNYSRAETIRGNTVDTLASKISFISNLKRPACASKRDVLELSTLRYVKQFKVIDTNFIKLLLKWLDIFWTISHQNGHLEPALAQKSSRV